MQEADWDSIPGGGAGFFDEKWEEICNDKCSSDEWLQIHGNCNRLHSNATMLYSHESFYHRIRTHESFARVAGTNRGFNTFIPLKFRNQGNDMAHIPEGVWWKTWEIMPYQEFSLDNFAHVKSILADDRQKYSSNYHRHLVWMIWMGTIDDTTRIYSMAGAEEQNPSVSTSATGWSYPRSGRTPVERDTLYHVVRLQQLWFAAESGMMMN